MQIFIPLGGIKTVYQITVTTVTTVPSWVNHNTVESLFGASTNVMQNFILSITTMTTANLTFNFPPRTLEDLCGTEEYTVYKKDQILYFKLYYLYIDFLKFRGWNFQRKHGVCCYAKGILNIWFSKLKSELWPCVLGLMTLRKTKR